MPPPAPPTEPPFLNLAIDEAAIVAMPVAALIFAAMVWAAVIGIPAGPSAAFVAAIPAISL